MDATPELNAALAAAQGEFPPITKDKEVKTGSYSYTYAPLDVILDKTRPVLSKHGLALIQLLEHNGNGPAIRTELRHAAGGVVGSSFPLPTMPQKAQELGSLLTYLRRYAIVALLGIAAEDDDDDGAQASEAKPAGGRKRQAAAARSQPPPVPPAEPDLPPAPPDPAFYKPEMIDATRRKRLMVLFRENTIEDRDERLSYVASVLGHPVETSNDLTRNEADEVIRHLEQFDRDNPQTYPFPDGF